MERWYLTLATGINPEAMCGLEVTRGMVRTGHEVYAVGRSTLWRAP